MTINYKLVYEVRKLRLRTDSLENLIVQYRNIAQEDAEAIHQKYLDFLTKELGNSEFEVTNVACLAEGIIGHVYVGGAPKGIGRRKCVFCGCDDFDF